MQLLPAAWAVAFFAVFPVVADDETNRRQAAEPKSAPADPSALTMTPPIACRSIDGFEDYETLPNASLTADEKLLIYYRPRNYRVDQKDGKYHIHLTEDGRVRARGGKQVFRFEEKLLEYKPKFDSPPGAIYIKTSVSLKGLKPGEYEFDVILHDALSDGPPVVRVVKFVIVAAVVPKAEDSSDTTKKPPSSPPPAKKKAKRRGRPAVSLRP